MATIKFQARKMISSMWIEKADFLFLFTHQPFIDPWLGTEVIQINMSLKKEPSHTAGGTANWYSHYGKHAEVPQKTKN